MLLEKFDKFLQSVDLNAYREKYRQIKIVEMDLPKNIQAIKTLYEIYWEKKKFLSFDDFYDEYFYTHRKLIKEFQKRTGMCWKCFKKGLPARIYRTWASIITQIHAGYVAESVFGQDSVKMSAELDYQGADFQASYRGKILNYQVKKKSLGREVRQERPRPQNPLAGDFVDIVYEVPNYERIINPRQRNGNFYSDYKAFKDKYLNIGYLKVLQNGFVVFTPYAFEKKKLEIDQSLK